MFAMWVAMGDGRGLTSVGAEAMAGSAEREEDIWGDDEDDLDAGACEFLAEALNGEEGYEVNSEGNVDVDVLSVTFTSWPASPP